MKKIAYGLSTVELHAPVNIHTTFNPGSIEKTFTKTAIMLLVKEGKLSLDDATAKHLDSLPIVNNYIIPNSKH